MKFTSYKSTVVKPETPTEYEVLSCSACDHMVRPQHVRTIYFFPEKAPGANREAPQILKNALKRLLVTFYPNAGRVRRKRDGSRELEIVCNDAGVVFVEAAVDITIDDVGSFQPSPLFGLLAPKADTSLPMEEQPVQYLQVTSFKCGGFALGLTNHHVVIDGVSAQLFVSSWTEVVSGKPLSVHPCYDHSLLNSGDVPVPSTRPAEVKILDNESPVAPFKLKKAKRERKFTFSIDQLRKIKEEANSDLAGDENTRPFTSFETLSAHVWRGIIRARRVQSDEEIRFFTWVDARKRLQPNLPDGYYGNAIFNTLTKTTAGELLSKPLAFSAKLVRRCVASMSDARMRSTVAWIDQQTRSNSKEVTDTMDNTANDVAIIGWLRMPFYETDFGFGKALFAGPVENSHQGNVLVAPSDFGPGFLNVFINLFDEDMQRLEVDPAFLMHKVIV